MFSAFGVDPESFVARFNEGLRLMRALWTEPQVDFNGRDPAGFPIAKRVYIAVDDNAERARERMRAALDRLYGFFGRGDMTPVSVSGTPDACVRGLWDVANSGAELILLNPLFDDAEQMERLAAEVVPQLS
jgi:alkanesulfonate monooxygenase SsuD/methylene tetrahydromethanopterin reductase-like flavin-dependent oxidoreductase (luciferase family)